MPGPHSEDCRCPTCLYILSNRSQRETVPPNADRLDVLLAVWTAQAMLEQPDLALASRQKFEAREASDRLGGAREDGLTRMSEA